MSTSSPSRMCRRADAASKKWHQIEFTTACPKQENRSDRGFDILDHNIVDAIIVYIANHSDVWSWWLAF